MKMPTVQANQDANALGGLGIRTNVHVTTNQYLIGEVKQGSRWCGMARVRFPTTHETC